MVGLIMPIQISCDEAGYSGPNLLDTGQPIFTYASTDLSEEEARDIINGIRTQYHIKAAELKIDNLLRGGRRADVVLDILNKIKGRYIVSIYDKQLVLFCKFFEYIYEPVIRPKASLFYGRNMHRFLAMYLYAMALSGSTAKRIAEEFQIYMRTLDHSKAPYIFDNNQIIEEDELLRPILYFCAGYKDIIYQERDDLQAYKNLSKWVLDLSITGLHTQLQYWGEKHPLIKVLCDASGPLSANAEYFNDYINNMSGKRSWAFGRTITTTYNLSSPIEFADSKLHYSLQIAEISAGAARYCFSQKHDPKIRKKLLKLLIRSIDETSILPDWHLLKGKDANTNRIILHGLGERAKAGENPTHLMDLLFRVFDEYG